MSKTKNKVITISEEQQTTTQCPPACPHCGAPMGFVGQSYSMLSESGYMPFNTKPKDDGIIQSFSCMKCDCSAEYEVLDDGVLKLLSATILYESNGSEAEDDCFTTECTNYAKQKYGVISPSEI